MIIWVQFAVSLLLHFLLSCVYTSVTSCSRLLCCPHWWFPKLLHLCLVNSVYPHLLLPCLSCQFGSSTREWTSVKLLDFCLCVFSSGQFFWPWVWQFGGFFSCPTGLFPSFCFVCIHWLFIQGQFETSIQSAWCSSPAPTLLSVFRCDFFGYLWAMKILNFESHNSLLNP